ncbi:NAD-dependent epimerase/dehydratase family protein [Xanthomonas sp. D-99]|uniref:NAD-dependent epimerase/dehydratase family protein n=1 Tax=Xanthomonas sp. D-99 TaxID=2821273 RepID=UPI001ADCE4F4|nr:NAD-dependent epimerase/dehydratase family protein [Xanthomonas sp. D-99]
MALRSDRLGRVLVTGASGFTGRYLTQALAEAGYRVIAWGCTSDHEVDINQRDQVLDALMQSPPDYVIHLAAVAFVDHDDVDELYRVNVLGTRNLLEGLAALPERPLHTLLVSSANVYGNVEGSIDEGLPLAPQNDYAVSKVAMEYMARIWTQKLPITFVRPFNYTGVGQNEKYLLPKIVGHFRRREPAIELGNLDVVRDFNDVRNVVEAYVALLSSVGQGDVFNVCSGVETSLADVIEMMECISGHKLDVRINPKFVRANDVRRLVGDGSRLKELVGTVAARPLESTLRWMFEMTGEDEMTRNDRRGS